MSNVIEVVNPYSLDAIGSVSASTWDDIDPMLDTALGLYQNQDGWLPAFQRIAVLKKTAAQMEARFDELAFLIANEGGKPLQDARVEVKRAIDGVELCIHEIGQMTGREIPMDLTEAGSGRIAFTRREPIGVVVAASAFNHPLNLIVHQVAPAVATGCPVIVKPARDTPLSCKAFVDMLTEAGATPRDSLSYEYAEANAAFASGQVAAMLQWNAAAGELTNPETAPAVADVVGTTAPPSGPEGRFTHIHGLGLGLNQAAENPEGAARFLQWLATEEGALIYARNQGSPALTPAVVSQVADERPDLEKLGQFAGDYGFVMTGGTSAGALSVYELQAREFTGYWAGQQSLDEALANAAAGMAELLQ